MFDYIGHDDSLYDVARKWEKVVSNNENHLLRKAHNTVLEWIDELGEDIAGIHLCGSDPLYYYTLEENLNDSKKLYPWSEGHTGLGSHLPIGFEGVREGYNIKDKVNYKFLKLCEDIPVTLEVSSVGSISHIESMSKSKENMEKIVQKF